jgi:hypothetical protein
MSNQVTRNDDFFIGIIVGLAKQKSLSQHTYMQKFSRVLGHSHYPSIHIHSAVPSSLNLPPRLSHDFSIHGSNVSQSSLKAQQDHARSLGLLPPHTRIPHKNPQRRILRRVRRPDVQFVIYNAASCTVLYDGQTSFCGDGAAYYICMCMLARSPTARDMFRVCMPRHDLTGLVPVIVNSGVFIWSMLHAGQSNSDIVVLGGRRVGETS